MKFFQGLSLPLLILVFFTSCTVKENFHFNKDLSGQYIFQFDYSGLIDIDSTASANDEMSKGYTEMEDELEKIDGISNIIILTDDDKGLVIVSYEFSGLKALNQANYNNETKRYNKFFMHDGNKIEFSVDFSQELEDYKDPEMDMAELLNNIESMIDYTMTISFENKIKVITLKNFNKIDDHTIGYTLNEEGILNPSHFQLKLK